VPLSIRSVRAPISLTAHHHTMHASTTTTVLLAIASTAAASSCAASSRYGDSSIIAKYSRPLVAGNVRLSSSISLHERL
jgi:hypothetical protein